MTKPKQDRRSWRQIAKGALVQTAILAAIAELKDPTILDVWRRIARDKDTTRSQGTVTKYVSRLLAEGWIEYAPKRRGDPFYRNRYTYTGPHTGRRPRGGKR